MLGFGVYIEEFFVVFGCGALHHDCTCGFILVKFTG